MSYLKMLERARGESAGYPGLLSVGELVRLKSGGPVMTVEGSTEGGNTMVVWTGKDGRPNRDSFSPELLKRHESVIRKWAS